MDGRHEPLISGCLGRVAVISDVFWIGQEDSDGLANFSGASAMHLVRWPFPAGRLQIEYKSAGSVGGGRLGCFSLKAAWGSCQSSHNR